MKSSTTRDRPRGPFTARKAQCLDRNNSSPVPVATLFRSLAVTRVPAMPFIEGPNGKSFTIF